MDDTAGYMVVAHKILVSALSRADSAPVPLELIGPLPLMFELGSTGSGLGLGGLGTGLDKYQYRFDFWGFKTRLFLEDFRPKLYLPTTPILMEI